MSRKFLGKKVLDWPEFSQLCLGKNKSFKKEISVGVWDWDHFERRFLATKNLPKLKVLNIFNARYSSWPFSVLTELKRQQRPLESLYVYIFQGYQNCGRLKFFLKESQVNGLAIPVFGKITARDFEITGSYFGVDNISTELVPEWNEP